MVGEEIIEKKFSREAFILMKVKAISSEMMEIRLGQFYCC
jgi:hypothetical protein